MLEAVIVGVTTGVIASLTAWWVLYHLMAPSIQFADTIKKEATANSTTGYYYQFKLGNMKRTSSAIDIDVRASVYFAEFPAEGVTNTYTIPVGGGHFFELTPRKDGATSWNRRVSLKVNDAEFLSNFDKTYFPDRIKSLARDKTLTLEDLFTVTDNVVLRLHAIATDSFSGSKRIFRSKPFRVEDIAIGKYERSSLRFVREAQ